MKICHTIVMFQNIFPDSHDVFVFAVKCTVYKFHLWNFVIQKKLQFFFYQFQITESEFFIYRRQAVTTRKRAASAALIINDTILKLLKMLVNKWDLT